VASSLDHAFGQDPSAAEGFNVKPPRAGYAYGEGLSSAGLEASPSMTDVEGQAQFVASDTEPEDASPRAAPYGQVYTAPPSSTHAGHPYMVPTPGPAQPAYSVHQRPPGPIMPGSASGAPAPPPYTSPAYQSQPYMQQQPFTPTVPQPQPLQAPGSMQGMAAVASPMSSSYIPARGGYSGYMSSQPPADPQQKQNFLGAMRAKYGQ
jgi:hypothetical protein